MAASILATLESNLPASLEQFDAFPKLPSSYQRRTSSGGIFSIVIVLACLLLTLNDVSEYFFGWPDEDFSMDYGTVGTIGQLVGKKGFAGKAFMNINVDIVVGMPCRFLSIDLRDAIGDRLMLSGGLRRDGTKFDVGQATLLKEHQAALSSSQVITAAKHTRSLFGGLWGGRANTDGFKPTYNNEPHGSACRVWGVVTAKKVTANLHITTLGHGYASHEHVDHTKMNLSHIITEFSFGPHFPSVIQPLDNSFELTHDPFVAYQYFMHVVPTVYTAAPSFSSSLLGLVVPVWGMLGGRTPEVVETNQYSVTHYTRKLEHGKGTPGIFFKFDVDPIKITITQRTTSILALMMRVAGVIGGLFTCTKYFYRVSSKAIAVVAGEEEDEAIVDVKGRASGAKTGLKAKWGGTELRSRPQGRMVPQGSGWVMEGGTPGTPSSSTFSSYSPYSSQASTPNPSSAAVGSPFQMHQRQSSYGGYTPHTPGFPPPPTPGFANALGTHLPPSAPGTPLPPPHTGTPGTGLGFNVPSAGPSAGVFPSSPLPGASFGSLSSPGPYESPSGRSPGSRPTSAIFPTSPMGRQASYHASSPSPQPQIARKESGKDD